jgi:hypothetical protein
MNYPYDFEVFKLKPESIAGVNLAPAGDGVLENRTNEMLRYRERRKWERWLGVVRPEFRYAALLSVRHEMPQVEFLQLAGHLWNSPEVPIVLCDFLLECFVGLEDTRPVWGLMIEEEITEFIGFRDRLSVYRSHNESNLCSLSWTTSLDWALEHKSMMSYPLLSQAIVRKSDCLAFFNRRCRAELIVDPGRLIDIKSVS